MDRADKQNAKLQVAIEEKGLAQDKLADSFIDISAKIDEVLQTLHSQRTISEVVQEDTVKCWPFTNDKDCKRAWNDLECRTALLQQIRNVKPNEPNVFQSYLTEVSASINCSTYIIL